MSDPAVEAARSVFQQMWPDQGDFEFRMSGSHGMWAINSAREALQPIRDLIDQLADDTVPPCHPGKRLELFEKAISALSPLLYTSKELEEGP